VFFTLNFFGLILSALQWYYFLIKRVYMKKVSFLGYKLLLGVIFSCMQIVLIAQETSGSSRTTTTTTTRTTWYTEPWVWVVGGAVFIILLVALMRGGSSKNTEVSRTTVIKE